MSSATITGGDKTIPRKYSPIDRRMTLKTLLFARAAACDRGFGASARDREEIRLIVDELSKLAPEAIPTRGLFPYKFGSKVSYTTYEDLIVRKEIYEGSRHDTTF
jgi:hypothetical protein